MIKKKAGRPVGRRSKYKKKFIKEVEKYIEECIERDKVPFKKEFALRVEVTEDTLSNWSKRNPKFLGAMKRLESYSEVQLMNGVISRKINPQGAQFLLQTLFNHVPASKQVNEGNQPVTVQLDMSGGYLPPQVTTQPQRPKPTKPS